MRKTCNKVHTVSKAVTGFRSWEELGGEDLLMSRERLQTCATSACYTPPHGRRDRTAGVQAGPGSALGPGRRGSPPFSADGEDVCST